MITAGQTHDLAGLMDEIREAENKHGLFLEGEVQVTDEDGTGLVDVNFGGAGQDAYVSGVYS